MLQLDTPDWWLEQNKDVPDSFRFLGQAIVSEKWKKDAAEYLKAFITYAEEKYSDVIFAYSFSAGLCTEWFMDDNGKPTPEKEEAYKKYLSDENVAIPVLGGDEYNNDCDLREPLSNERKYMDFCCELNRDLVCYFASQAQEVLNHKKLVGVFYGYIDQGTAFKQNLFFTNKFEKVFCCEDIDIMFSPASYNDNRYFDGVPMFQYPVDSLKFNNKLYLHEIDHRTDLSFYPLSTGKFMWDCYETAEESIMVLRRELCNAMLKKGAIWWFDFYGGYFASPEYEKELTKQISIYKELYESPFEQVADVAVFVDSGSMNLMKERVELVPECVRANLTEILKSGAMIKTYNICDIKKVNKDEFKLFVFANILDVPEDIISYINEELADKYKFFVYAPDIAGDNLDYKRVEKLIGMKLKQFEGKEIHTAEYGGEQFGFSKAVSPAFYIDDEMVDVVSRYTDGKVCCAKKGNTFYCAAGNIPYKLWQYVEKEVGAHIYTYDGGFTAITTKFIAHQNTKSETCVIELPFECKVEEMFDGGVYETKDKKLSYTVPVGHTKLFKIL